MWSPFPWQHQLLTSFARSDSLRKWTELPSRKARGLAGTGGWPGQGAELHQEVLSWGTETPLAPGALRGLGNHWGCRAQCLWKGPT